MIEIPQGETDTTKKDDECDEASWSEDQKKHEYYYDDAHGYEIYVPDDEEARKPVDESHD